MKELIEVYKMEEINPKTRARVIRQLGECINRQYADNLTEGIVFELVQLLDPEDPILKDNFYRKMAGLTPLGS